MQRRARSFAWFACREMCWNIGSTAKYSSTCSLCYVSDLSGISCVHWMFLTSFQTPSLITRNWTTSWRKFDWSRKARTHRGRTNMPEIHDLEYWWRRWMQHCKSKEEIGWGAGQVQARDVNDNRLISLLSTPADVHWILCIYALDNRKLKRLFFSFVLIHWYLKYNKTLI